MQALINDITSCEKCPLYKGMPLGPVPPNNIVSDLMIVGESPTQSDADMWDVLTGREGRFFKEKILKPAGINNFYYTNLIKCVCKTPKSLNIKSCDWIHKEIEKTKPKVIVSLGKIVSMKLLKNNKLKMYNTVGVRLPHPSIKNISIHSEYKISSIMMFGNQKIKETIERFKLIKESL